MSLQISTGEFINVFIRRNEMNCLTMSGIDTASAAIGTSLNCLNLYKFLLNEG